MRTRLPIPPASVLHELFIYKNGALYWKNDASKGRTKAGDFAGYLDPQGYITVGVFGKYLKAHRVVWRMHHPKGKMPKVLDHIDGNRSNNKIENLRIATHSMNMLNRKPQEKPKPRKGNKLVAVLGERHERRRTADTD